MAADNRFVIASEGTAAEGNPLPTAEGYGAVIFPRRATLKRAADGSHLSASPPIDADDSIIKTIVRDSAGVYTVTLNDKGQTAAQVAAGLGCNTAGLVGSVVVTDATHLAIATKTDAGVATDSIFSLWVDFLSLT